MRSNESDVRRLKDQIAEWLELTKGMELPLGLEIEEALERASELMPLILDGKISSAGIELDEEFKDVLYGLVALLVEAKKVSGGLPRETEAVFRFISGIEWLHDSYGEKEELLRECAAESQEAIGSGIFGTDSAWASRPGAHGDEALSGPAQDRIWAEDLSGEEIRRLMDEAVGRARMALIAFRQLTEPQARKIEEQLYLWVTRFVRRSGSFRGDLKALLSETYARFARQLSQADTKAIPLPANPKASTEAEVKLEDFLDQESGNRRAAHRGRKGPRGSGDGPASA